MLAATHARWFASQFRELAAMAHVQVGSLMADIRAAVRTLIAGGDLSDAADLVVAVRAYWDATYLTWEASEWLETIIALLDPADVAIETLVAAGWAAYLHHDYALARDRYRTALDVAREKGDARFEGVALFGLGRIEAPISPPTAESLLDEALERFRSADAVRDEAACLLALGVGLAWRGAAARARDHLVRCLDTIGDDGDPEVRSVCHRYLSLCAWYEGDAAAAAEHARRAETIARDADDDRRLSGALLQRALVAVGSGDLPDAAAAALEAFAPIPAYASIDLALVSFGAVPVLVACDEHALAGEVFAMIDEVFAAHGWMRIDQRSPLAAELRARVEEPSGPRSAPELRTDLTATLARFSRR